MSFRRPDPLHSFKRPRFPGVLLDVMLAWILGLGLLPVVARAADGGPIQSVTVEEPAPLPDNAGDTWVSAWAKNGAVYTPSDDTQGFRNVGSANIAFNRIDADDPLRLSGVTINPMPDYGAAGEELADGCTWKSSGCYAVDGVLYWVVARHKYGEKSGDAIDARPPPTPASSCPPWDFYQASKPWGPWIKISSHRFSPQGFYSPQVCPKFKRDGGHTLFVFTAEDWNNPDVYRLTVVPITLRTAAAKGS